MAKIWVWMAWNVSVKCSVWLAEILLMHYEWRNCFYCRLYFK